MIVHCEPVAGGFLTSLGMAREIVADGLSSMLVSTERDGYIFPNASTFASALHLNRFLLCLHINTNDFLVIAHKQ
ncbi:MAG: hypothetical protein WCO86_08905, partial [Planctomycetota bacterium]